MCRFDRVAAVVAVALAFVLTPCAIAAPQPTPVPPAPAQAPAAATAPSAAEIEALVRTLKSDKERQKLIGQLETMLAATRAGEKAAPVPPLQGAGVQLLAGLSDNVQYLSHDFVAAMRSVFDLRHLRRWVASELSRPDAGVRWITVLWKVAAAIAAGFAARWLVGLSLAPPRRALEIRPGGTSWRKVLPLALRSVLDFIPVVAFFAASYATLTIVQPDRVARLVALGIINAYVAAGIIMVAGRAALAPNAPGLRLPPIRDDDANYLYLWLRRLTNLVAYGYALAATAHLLGLGSRGAAALLHLVGLLVALLLVVFVLQNRAAVAGCIRGGDRHRPAVRLMRARLADVWHVLAIVYIIGMFVVWALAIRGGFEFMLQATALTALILAATRLVLAGMQRIFGQAFALNEDLRRRYPGLESRANRYLPVAERSAAAIVYVVAVFALLEAWGIDSFAVFASGAGQRFVGSLAASLVTIIVAAVTWELASAWIERYLANGSADGSRRAARMRTLLPLLRTSVLVMLVVMAVLIVLSQFGVDIAPLLAGAGVVGLAIGFGSQALVRDVITGAFILAEDQLSVGDVVKVGANSGVVERLTLRTIWLRGADGTVQVVPFGEVKTVENMTKDFSCYVFDVQVAYREDTDRVIEVLREIGDELRQDTDLGPLITVPLEVMGVDSFGDNAVVIKAKITTRPIQQWKVGREFNRRMKKRFDAEGIEMPFPHRTIYFGVDKAGNAPPARIALQGADGGAAALAAPAPPPHRTGDLPIAPDSDPDAAETEPTT